MWSHVHIGHRVFDVIFGFLQVMKTVSFFTLLIIVLHSLQAQTTLVPAGNSSVSASGFISVSLGQVTRLYTSNGRHSFSQGVQQPYCPTHFDTVMASVCQHDPYSDGTFSIPADSTAHEGMCYFSRRYLAEDGCDSVVTLALTIHPVTRATTNATACDSLLWHDSLIVSSGTYTRQALSSKGCDSTTTLRLTIHHSSVSTSSAQAYMEYQWHGRILTSSGIYADTLLAANSQGCDSVVNFSLSLINDAIPPVIYCFSRRLIMVDHYPWGEDSTRVEYRAYRWYHDGELLPHATTDNIYDHSDGRYYNLHGCYYVEVPADANANFWVRSNVLCIMSEDEDLRTPSLTVYPNPSSAHTNLTALISDCPSESILLLHDAFGRLLYSGAASDGGNAIPMDIVTGTYTVSLRSPQGEVISRKLIVR